MRLVSALVIAAVVLGGCSEEQFRDAGNRSLRNMCQQNSQSCSIDCGVGKTADNYGECR